MDCKCHKDRLKKEKTRFIIGTKNSKDVKKIKEKIKGLEDKLEIVSHPEESCCPTQCLCYVYDGDWLTNEEHFPKGGLIVSVYEPLEDLQVQADCDYAFTNYRDIKFSAFGFDGLLVTVYYGSLPKKPAKKIK